MADESRTAKSKVQSSSSPSWASGGPRDGMASRTGVNTAVAGHTVAQNRGNGGDWAKGGSGGMHSRTGTRTRDPGKTGGLC